MNHDEFVREYKEGRLGFAVKNPLRYTEALPSRLEYPLIFWNWVSLALFVAIIPLWIFYAWWAALICFVLSLMFHSGNKRSAHQFVCQYALENEEFYEQLQSKDELILRKKE